MLIFEGEATVKYCEPSPQIFNIFSNVFYIIASMDIYRLGYKVHDISRVIKLVGFGSFCLHYYENLIGQFLDEIWMIVLLNTMIKKCNSNRFLNDYYTEINYILFTVYFSHGVYELFLIIFSLQCTVLTFLLMQISIKYPYTKGVFNKAILSIVIGSAAWIIEQKYCEYNDYIYLLHTLWHFMSALSVLYVSKMITLIP